MHFLIRFLYHQATINLNTSYLESCLAHSRYSLGIDFDNIDSRRALHSFDLCLLFVVYLFGRMLHFQLCLLSIFWLFTRAMKLGFA
ncbi:unnamed protein product [Camellia sinensis]